MSFSPILYLLNHRSVLENAQYAYFVKLIFYNGIFFFFFEIIFLFLLIMIVENACIKSLFMYY